MSRLIHLMALLASVLAFNAVALESPFKVIGATTINVHQARQLFDAGAVFVDVRSDRQWRWGHIKGARHLELRRDFGKLFYPGYLNRDTPLVIYCNDLDCKRSAFASYLAARWGYTQVYYFRDGYYSWLAWDMPIQTQRSDERFDWAER
ncbi:rhodanese-like domain-containing protein [Aestuariirhabdus litorea]|uniref:Rhodanese-like domain-containing protein n=1 Tax=Aestuariirhabdus litorea TaxID=2528527 RepID=A0A3P3VRT3_9GAMM|nr:rhodanese-like domain-containing protein [Aestuariirhabdus litorea]RRJ84406.1 rhodanese-like domain-containing protein [Aestuariirhabdus litorea]RWW97630.1 rhodanese-like domain-containing protein [Endozoicomonadaceae bacterium GTF-13]